VLAFQRDAVATAQRIGIRGPAVEGSSAWGSRAPKVPQQDRGRVRRWRTHSTTRGARDARTSTRGPRIPTVEAMGHASR